MADLANKDKEFKKWDVISETWIEEEGWRKI